MYKIMIVDDDKLARLGLMNSVKWSDYSMKVVFDTAQGEEAIAYAKKNQVDLAFLDLEMPGMFGLELLKRLKKMGSKTQCVILTMHSEFSYIQEALRIGVLDYIIKTELGGDNLAQVMAGLKMRIETLEHIGVYEFASEEGESISYEIRKCIGKAMELVQTERGKYLSATEVAMRVNMSRSYFSTCFKQLVGKSFNEYFKEVRLELAKKALIETDKTIGSIAEESGFTEESYFSTVFKSYTGMRPSEYRRTCEYVKNDKQI